MANYDYKGTKITGTSTTAKVFKKSGVSSAKVNDIYFNTSTGHVYKCSTKGKPKDAKWKYIRTDIAHKPDKTVTKLAAPARTSYKLESKWDIPAAMKNEKSGSRATGIKVIWSLNTSDKKTPKKKSTHTGGTGYTSSSINLNNLTIGRTTYTRQLFYPVTNRKLHSVSVSVVPTNSKGNGSAVTKTIDFKKPRKPTLSAYSFNTETGDLSITIDTNAGTDSYERYDTRFKMSVYSSVTKKTTVIHDGSSTSTSITKSYDAAGYQGMSYGQYLKVTTEAWARGFEGDSEHVSRTYYISYPAQVTIKGVSVSSKQSDGKFTASIDTNHKAEHPVDRVRLEYLANVPYATAKSIPGSADWTASDITDDNACTALSMPVGALLPDPGKHTWVRVKSWHANESVLYRYSEPKEVPIATPAPTAADDDIVILSATAGADGKSIVVHLGWNADGTDDSTGTELTWSEAEDAWRSTEGPDVHNFAWSDGQVVVGNTTYRDSAMITIKGLDEGTKYYIKARRYLEGDDGTSYSEYSNTETAITSETPESIVVSCNRYVPAGESLPVYWTFSGNGIQTEWQIVKTEVSYEQTTDTQVVGVQTYYEYDSTTQTYSRVTPEGDENPATEGWYVAVYTAGTVIAEGKGGISATQIDAERLAAHAAGNELTFTVHASTGSGFVASEEHTVMIIDPPILSVSLTSPLAVQPLSFNAAASRVCDLKVIITSLGAAGQFPQGVLEQVSGDTIHSGIYSPEWMESQGTYTAEVRMPAGLDFWDLGAYEVSVVAIDRETGLYSAESRTAFTVVWETQAVDPADNIVLTPVDTVDDNQMHHQAVQIELTPPTGSSETDVYDIYRLTGDGAYLIGEGFPLTCTVTDEYAPFGDDLTHYYRVAIRTVDGDVEFADAEYTFDCDFMRFDWATGSLELPYNISIGDKYSKDVDIRKHMDGSVDGYWNPTIGRTASLSSDVIRLTMQDEIDAARLLARYAGPVFVRTPDGSAYEADVQVSDMSTEGVLTAIAIDATEIGLTQEFILPTPYTFEESGESGESGSSGGSGGA